MNRPAINRDAALDESHGPAGVFSRAELEALLAGRTAELHALRLEMDAFTHSVTHDLRGPLMNIGGFADLLLERSDEKLDDKGREYLRTIIGSADLLARMLAGISALTRLSRADLTPAPVEVAAVVDELCAASERSEPDRRIEWSLGELPVVTADPLMLRHVLTQVLGNAVKFTKDQETARIEIAAQVKEAEIVISVRDNGVGFAAKDSERIFGVFQRLQPAAQFPGQGVGLAGVRRIMQRHGGRVWAEGVAGEGAVFYLAWPAKARATG